MVKDIAGVAWRGTDVRTLLTTISRKRAKNLERWDFIGVFMDLLIQ
jgi:hypothetical protein